MKRLPIYFAFACSTFAIGTLAALLFLWKTNQPTAKIENLKAIESPNPNANISEPTASRDATKQEPAERQNLHKYTCRDKRILPAWSELLKDKDFQEQAGFGEEEDDCAEMLEAAVIDLNRDGQKEIILRGKNIDLCSAVGNCDFWVFEKKNRKYRMILNWGDHLGMTRLPKQIRKTRTKGYSDLLLKSHYNASDTSFNFFKYDGEKYKQSKCLVYAHIPGTIDNSDGSKSKFVTCREYEKW